MLLTADCLTTVVLGGMNNGIGTVGLTLKTIIFQKNINLQCQLITNTTKEKIIKELSIKQVK